MIYIELRWIPLQILPFGGARRTPKVKQIVLDVTKRDDWQPFINDDETAALGAVFVAANFSKVRELVW